MNSGREAIFMDLMRHNVELLSDDLGNKYFYNILNKEKYSLFRNIDQNIFKKYISSKIKDFSISAKYLLKIIN